MVSNSYVYMNGGRGWEGGGGGWGYSLCAITIISKLMIADGNYFAKRINILTTDVIKSWKLNCT